MLQWLYTYDASVLFQMFQMLQTYDARVLSRCCICFMHMFGSVLSGCCICFTHMLQVFYLNVAYVLQWLHTCFPGVFIRMLQVFQLIQTYDASVLYLDVAKVDLVLHMLQ
jgi:hypothetical protein